MRPWKSLAAASVLAAAVVAGLGPREAEAGPALLLKRFLVGHIASGTGRFVATGGRGSLGVFRDSVILLVFSAPLDLDCLNSRTVRIGIPTAPDLLLPARGAFYRYSESKYDAVSGTWIPKRTYRNRVLFDPLARQDPFGLGRGEPLEADTTYSVTIPGVDGGATKTVMSSRGKPMAITFTTTFRTSDEEFSEISCPPMDEE